MLERDCSQSFCISLAITAIVELGVLFQKIQLRSIKKIPWGEDLVNNDLKQSLLAVLTKLDPDKLCKLDTSNNNESFNNTLRSKAPKDKHYSDGGSLAHRLSAAVCQKNEGYGYVCQVQFFLTFLHFSFLKLL